MELLSRDQFFWQWYAPGSPAYQYYEVANSFPGQTAADKQYNYANARDRPQWGFESAYQDYAKQVELTTQQEQALKAQQEQAAALQAQYAATQQRLQEQQVASSAVTSSLKILQAGSGGTAPTAQMTKRKAAGGSRPNTAASSLRIGSTGQAPGSGANVAV